MVGGMQSLKLRGLARPKEIPDELTQGQGIVGLID